MPLKRKRYTPKSSYYPSAKRKRGLVPSYTGWNPRSFVRKQSPEWKYRDIQSAKDPITIAGSIWTCNQLTIGASPSQRVGQRITCKSLELRYQLFPDSNLASPVMSRVRIVVYINYQENGTLPVQPLPLTAMSFVGGRNLSYRAQFKILYDKIHIMYPCLTYPSEVIRHVYMKFRKPLITQYNSGNTGNYSDIQTGAIHILMFSDHPSDAPTPPSYYMLSRLRYIDT